MAEATPTKPAIKVRTGMKYGVKAGRTEGIHLSDKGHVPKREVVHLSNIKVHVFEGEVGSLSDMRHVSEVRYLADKARKNLRLVVRDLVKIRRITGVGELVNLGKFLGEVGMQETAPAALDRRLEEATERGVAVREKLTQAEGGSLSAEEAGKRLGMSKVAVLKRYQKGRLLGWQEERQKAIRFPAWQFQDGRVLAGLEDVLQKLNEDSRLDDFGKLLFFLSNSRFLGGKRPLDCLREGELHNVVQAAEGYVQ